MTPEADTPVARLRRWFRLVTAALSSVLLLALTFVTIIDVIGRYVLSSPLPGAGEYTEILLMAIIFIGLPAVCLDDSHITVDLFTAQLRGFLARLQLNLARLFVSVALAVIAWQLWKHATLLASYNEVTVYLRAPLAPICKGAAIITGASAVMTFLMAVFRVPRGQEGGGV